MAAPEPTVTDRGFKHHDRVPSEYGGYVRVYESSAAMGPHIWLKAESPVDLNDPAGPMKEAVAHLTLENAELLRDQLTQLVENHYQSAAGVTSWTEEDVDNMTRQVYQSRARAATDYSDEKWARLKALFPASVAECRVQALEELAEMAEGMDAD